MCLTWAKEKKNWTVAQWKPRVWRKVGEAHRSSCLKSSVKFPQSVMSSNAIITPAGFYIVGLSTMPYVNIYVIFLTVLYVITVMCNVFLITIIFYDHRLHVPKFMAVANLAVVDLVLSTSLVPSMIKTYIVRDNFVPFKLCIVQMYIYYVFISLEPFSLCILAYDRFVAICFPLRQESINTNNRMAFIIGVIWLFFITIVLYGSTSIPTLSFCGSLEVHSYFCDYAPVLILACNDMTSQWNFGTTMAMMLFTGPLIFIFFTYVGILIAVFRMKNTKSRFKALSTCVEHLILVAIFFIPIVTIFSLILFEALLSLNMGLVSLSLSSLITPFVNPILYSLKTKEIRNRIHSILTQRLSVHPLKTSH
ncbi:olfactory receptor 24-like [Puntigrus tetrazona]|uniref:olfactory receptor 24-like n=1 Tax=Puntigrus tetrazona TaxID=1606681 RepID=UPI001C895F33|nr:olfactory receptor 24-like [Puntigrus tetrazona]